MSFTYDADGLRTSKTVNGVKHTYYYASGKLLRESYGNTTLDFFYDASGNAYALSHKVGDAEPVVYYYITNLQGDVMSIVDETGAVKATYSYDPYGNIVTATGDLANINPLRYRGYYFDSETGMYYLQSRYYDPELGRFINADSCVSTGQGLLGNNMFAYCGNNPIVRFDPTGTCFKVIGILLIDCHQSTCPDSRYFNAKQIAVIYDARQSGILNGLIFGQGFEHQGKELVERLGRNNYVEEYPFYDAEGFMDSWDSLSGEYDEIYIICHSEYGNLYFSGGAVSVSGKKYQYSQLQAVDVEEMFLYCCNGATISETGHSVAMSFHEITGATIHAIRDGKIGFTWDLCYPYPTDGGTWETFPSG